jgi:hypothetical protein
MPADDQRHGFMTRRSGPHALGGIVPLGEDPLSPTSRTRERP